MGNKVRMDQDTDSVKTTEYIRELETELQSMTLLNNQYLKKIKSMERKNEYLNTQIQSLHNFSSQESDDGKQDNTDKKRLESNIDILRNSYSFRVGEILVNAFTKPGKNTVMMPFRIIKLLFNFFINRRFS